MQCAFSSAPVALRSAPSFSAAPALAPALRSEGVRRTEGQEGSGDGGMGGRHFRRHFIVMPGILSTVEATEETAGCCIFQEFLSFFADVSSFITL